MNKHLVAVVLWAVFLLGSLCAVVFVPEPGVKMFFGFAAFVMACALYDSVEKLQQ